MSRIIARAKFFALMALFCACPPAVAADHARAVMDGYLPLADSTAHPVAVLAVCLAGVYGQPPRYEPALPQCERQAEKGSGPALLALYVYYSQGPHPDAQKAALYLRNAVRQGHGPAYLALAQQQDAADNAAGALVNILRYAASAQRSDSDDTATRVLAIFTSMDIPEDAPMARALQRPLPQTATRLLQERWARAPGSARVEAFRRLSEAERKYALNSGAMPRQDAALFEAERERARQTPAPGGSANDGASLRRMNDVLAVAVPVVIVLVVLGITLGAILYAICRTKRLARLSREDQIARAQQGAGLLGNGGKKTGDRHGL